MLISQYDYKLCIYQVTQISHYDSVTEFGMCFLLNYMRPAILKPLVVSHLDCISAHLLTIMPPYVETVVAWFVATRTYSLPNMFREFLTE